MSVCGLGGITRETKRVFDVLEGFGRLIPILFLPKLLA